MMWALFLERFAEDPLWIGGSLGLMLLVFGLVLLSLIRQRRQLLWFFLASAVMAATVTGLMLVLPEVLQLLVSYRSDWSLLFLVQNVEMLTLLTQLVFLVIWYAAVALVLVFVLALWSLVTFRWQRLRILFQRALRQSWFILFFAVMTLLMNVLTAFLVDPLQMMHMEVLLHLGLFVFSLQAFLRLVDNAYLHTPHVLMEYLYASGLMILLGRFFLDWVQAFGQDQLLVKSLFLEQLFSFFLVILMLGFLGTFFVRALFASAFFLGHYHRQTSLLQVWTSRLLLSSKDRHYQGVRMLMGMGLSFLVGFLFLELVLMELYLAFVPLLFLGYFVLFLLLDRQDDMRVRGDLVDKRIETAVNQVFFS